MQSVWYNKISNLFLIIDGIFQISPPPRHRQLAHTPPPSYLLSSDSITATADFSPSSDSTTTVIPSIITDMVQLSSPCENDVSILYIADYVMQEIMMAGFTEPAAIQV